MNRVTAVVGMCGSGKSVAAEQFIRRGWSRIYFGGVTLDTLRERGMAVTPDNERAIREELRAVHGQAAYAVYLLPKIREALKTGNVVLDGLYSWSEYRYLRENLGDSLSVLCVIASRRERYARLAARPVRPLTPEQAAARDIAEIEQLEKGGPIAFADDYLLNHGSVEEFETAVNAYLDALPE